MDTLHLQKREGTKKEKIPHLGPGRHTTYRRLDFSCPYLSTPGKPIPFSTVPPTNQHTQRREAPTTKDPVSSKSLPPSPVAPISVFIIPLVVERRHHHQDHQDHTNTTTTTTFQTLTPPGRRQVQSDCSRRLTFFFPTFCDQYHDHDQDDDYDYLGHYHHHHHHTTIPRQQSRHRQQDT